MKIQSMFSMLTASVLIGGLSTTLVACGNASDGGVNSASTALSGVVAGDAASTGTVQLRDGSGTRLVAAIDGQDGFQFDVSGLTAPFTLRAALTNGKTLSAVAPGPDVVGVDPISTVAFRASGDDDKSGSEDRAADSTRQGKFSALLSRLREVMAPLFSCYGITPSTSPKDPAWRTLFSEVRFEVDDGIVTVTNRQTGATIYSAKLSAIAQGTFTAAGLPGRCSGTPAPTACTSIVYSGWGTCQADGTQSRTVTSATPTGCDQSAAALTQSCTPSTTVALSAVSVNPASVTGGSPATGTVTLTAAAPAGGTSIALSSSKAAATVPASVTVAPGATTATFTVSTTTVSAATTATVTATYGGTSRNATLTVNAPAALVCTSCHGTSGPTTGQHTFHIVSRNLACSSCHGAGYDFQARTVNSATHQNGTVELTVSNWSAANRTCGGCHSAGSRSW